MKVEILNKEDITEAVQNQVFELYKQLNPIENQMPLKTILAENNPVIAVVCKDDEVICGIALLVTYKVLAGYRGLIEDVVVDENYRGKGIGKKIMKKLTKQGKTLGLDEILLFSGHHRTAAIALYKSLGYIVRNSGVYQLKL